MPTLVTATMSRSLRAGKVFLDWSQNNAAKTTIAPYSLRGRQHPTVAAPRTWDEIGDPSLSQLRYDEVLARVERDGDLLAGLDGPRASAASDRLSTYRGMRDAARTPEPVPTAPAAPPHAGGTTRFVIQEHRARRLHYDFRLERDGVLVSWAVPKNLPDAPSENHLAVRTEDHPLAYAGFEGTIPKPEYGVGTVTFDEAAAYYRAYIATAVGGDYVNAWNMLSERDQGDYERGFDQFVGFWQSVSFAEVQQLERLGGGPSFQSMRVEMAYGQVDGDPTSFEVIEVDVNVRPDGLLQIFDYRFIGAQ